MSRQFRRVAVYCASSRRTVPRYGDLAYGVGRWLAERGIGVVYGGGRVGLMGRVADGALDHGGEVIGVIPERLMSLELGNTSVTQLLVTKDMHERKSKMAELSDGFVALPGGWGTFEELFEATTWTQLGYQDKPVGLVNAEGYYDALLAQLQRSVDDGFIAEEAREILVHGSDIATVMERMSTVRLPHISEWLPAN